LKFEHWQEARAQCYYDERSQAAKYTVEGIIEDAKAAAFGSTRMLPGFSSIKHTAKLLRKQFHLYRKE
jgi:hypothetical protein